jgi:hypothetical protein
MLPQGHPLRVWRHVEAGQRGDREERDRGHSDDAENELTALTEVAQPAGCRW